jgi:hypothetical protein
MIRESGTPPESMAIKVLALLREWLSPVGDIVPIIREGDVDRGILWEVGERGARIMGEKSSEIIWDMVNDKILSSMGIPDGNEPVPLPIAGEDGNERIAMNLPPTLRMPSAAPFGSKPRVKDVAATQKWGDHTTRRLQTSTKNREREMVRRRARAVAANQEVGNLSAGAGHVRRSLYPPSYLSGMKTRRNPRRRT